nr:hypothetical protein [Tanacetum cinerariifolium]
VQTSGSGISYLLAVATIFTGSGNLYCQWELLTWHIHQSRGSCIVGLFAVIDDEFEEWAWICELTSFWPAAATVGILASLRFRSCASRSQTEASQSRQSIELRKFLPVFKRIIRLQYFIRGKSRKAYVKEIMEPNEVTDPVLGFLNPTS